MTILFVFKNWFKSLKIIEPLYSLELTTVKDTLTTFYRQAQIGITKLYTNISSFINFESQQIDNFYIPTLVDKGKQIIDETKIKVNKDIQLLDLEVKSFQNRSALGVYENFADSPIRLIRSGDLTSVREINPHPVVLPTTKIVRCSHHTDNQLRASRMFDETIAKIPAIDFDGHHFTIDVPVVFYITDPELVKSDAKQPYIDKRVAEIIVNINKCYNAGYYDNVTPNRIIALYSQIFKGTSTEATRAKAYFEKKIEVLNKVSVKWNFTLLKIIKRTDIDIPFSDDSAQRAKISALCPPVTSQLLELDIIVPYSLATGAILGIAQFPFNDSGVIDHQVFINSFIFNKSFTDYDEDKTFVHEIGHHFGLLHTFDNISYQINTEMKNQGFASLPNESINGDLIADTQEQGNPTFGTINPNPTNQLGYANYQKCLVNPSTFDNFNNFMDYTDDDQMFYFTEDQHKRLIYAVTCFFPALITVTPKTNQRQSASINKRLDSEEAVIKE